jgi:tripartite-type tricarboxylate transporter receptor subunit TctC
VQDLLAGQIPLVIDTAAETLEYHRAGRLRILAVTGEKRSRLLPDVPTMKEAGVDVASDGFLALYGPAGMAPALVTRVSSAVAEVMKMPDVQERIAALGQQASYAPAADLARMQVAHYRRWEAPIKASGFTAD